MSVDFSTGFDNSFVGGVLINSLYGLRRSHHSSYLLFAMIVVSCADNICDILDFNAAERLY